MQAAIDYTSDDACGQQQVSRFARLLLVHYAGMCGDESRSEVRRPLKAELR
jgi:hypothetical protein